MFTRLKMARQLLEEGGLSVSINAARWHLNERLQEARLKIDTSEYVAIDQLTQDTTDSEAYEPISFWTLSKLFDRIGPKPGGTPQVLLDAGCGKGRSMVFAGTYPYAQVLGFDLSPLLVEQARSNVARAESVLRCPNIRVDVANAMNYRLPDNVTTIVLFNPFRGEIMRSFLDGVRGSMQRRPRELSLAFINHAVDLQAHPWLQPTDSFRAFDPRMGKAHDYHHLVRLFRAAPFPK